MSLSTRSYSKESRSSSHYSRSSSYHASSNNGYNSSCAHRSFIDDRPLSTRLIERDSSCPSLAWNCDLDDPFFFDRCRWRCFDNDFLKLNFGLGRQIPINYRRCNNLSFKSIPIQYAPTTNRRHYQIYNTSDDLSSSFSKRHNENAIMRENRIASGDWPKPEPPTRKRTSMTIFIQQPFVPQTEIPYYRQTPLTPTYPKSARLDYY
ncbi:unnamed protein product [Adineta steineri]|uniref:Uncharacterized protein n=1 Tax=Adineta steineri TaxID=433720 RepID=A0A815L3A5_9BILA|nr:unnamed protein product [Adineta steineri]CAF1481905.1 unnamed protein product [Adineta steineri]CAF3699620.1 unnamed protein product [Adineta steineri]CAF3704941.1 unnamed protein product [Adineta steineri]